MAENCLFPSIWVFDYCFSKETDPVPIKWNCNLFILYSKPIQVYKVSNQIIHYCILRKKCYWTNSISFQRHVYNGFKSICYVISNIFIGSCSIFLRIHNIHAFGKTCFWFNSIFFSVYGNYFVGHVSHLIYCFFVLKYTLVYTENKMLLNQKHFFPKACILLIHKNILQEAINMLLIL